ncbi:MAG: transglutaminase-like cysteine peptidase [Rhodospirillales bacterium]|nr:transglutaminase-like cysteine peptidase [Rhodospirillales bacterium]
MFQTKRILENHPFRSRIKTLLPAALAVAFLMTAFSVAEFSGGNEEQEDIAAIANFETASGSSNKMNLAGSTYAPIGFVGFCYRNPQECSTESAEPVNFTEMRLTDARFDQLAQVHRKFNAAIRPLSDRKNYGRQEHWAYPTNGYGDCEDYALAKRKALSELGWPQSSLLFAEAFTEKGERHLVLIAVTDKGDYVLDNRQRAVWLWSDLHYKWLSRQSASNGRKWLKVATSG